MMDDLLQEMIDPAPVHHDAPRRRRLWATVAIVGLAAVGATTLTTSALFTDNDSSSASIESGTVDLEVGETPLAFGTQNLLPGASTFAPLQINSSGSLALRYAITYSATVADGAEEEPVLDPAPTVVGDLRDVLVLSVYEGIADGACNAAGITAAGATPINVQDDVWPGTSSPLVGNVAIGFQTGDRALDSGQSELLCFRVDFPSTPENQNEYQDSSVTLNLTFSAEQTAHN